MLQMFTTPIGEMQRQFQQFELEARAEMRAQTTRLATQVITGLQARMPPAQRNKGNFSFVVVTDKPGEVSAEVYLRQDRDAGGFKFFAGGTKPHRIEGHPLRWYDKQGVPHFAMFVQHPGTSPSKTTQVSEAPQDLGMVAELLIGKRG